MSNNIICFIAFVLIVFVDRSFAQQIQKKPSSDYDQQLIITSDRQSKDNTTNILTAIGNVRIKYAEKGIIITYNWINNQLKK